jgi:hypothetical protein
MVAFRFYTCVSLLLILLIASCNKQEDPPEFHYNYFDLTPGRYIEYDVMEIRHDVLLSPEHDTTIYQLRTVIGDTVIDNQGRIARKFIRYQRPDSGSSWVQTDLWTTIIDQNRAELIEENQRVIKLVFAPTLSKEWNPNSFNIYPEQSYFYRDIHDSYSVGSLFFDSTLFVIQEEMEESNLVIHKQQFEVYAKGVGLVRKYFKDLQIQNFDTLYIQSGKELFYTCTAYGIQ